MYGHLRCLSPKAAALSFFDPQVPVDTKKKKMKVALNRDTEKDITNRYVLNPKASISILNKGLDVV